jgi:hypothetical protein
MKNAIKQLNISELSKHLFWDVTCDELDPVASHGFIIRRVLQYGTMADWRRIVGFYGIQAIAQVAMRARDIDRKSAALVSLLAGVRKEKFKCYADKQSTMKHWVC